jgi:hypothetical protein
MRVALPGKDDLDHAHMPLELVCARVGRIDDLQEGAIRIVRWDAAGATAAVVRGRGEEVVLSRVVACCRPGHGHVDRLARVVVNESRRRHRARVHRILLLAAQEDSEAQVDDQRRNPEQDDQRCRGDDQDLAP